MKKDIFIDNNISPKLANPPDAEYKTFIQWLIAFDKENPEQNAYLVVSQKLLMEYMRSNQNASKGTNIVVIIGQLTKQGRLIKISNKQIKDFQKEHFTKKVIKKLRSNKEDHDHIPVVLLSDRKYALTLDEKFAYDLLHFPGFTATVAHSPEGLPYDD